MSSKRNIKEFIAMIALVTSLGALSIDAVMPAFDSIAEDLSIELDERYWVISSLILGMSFGQLIYGPWSDHSGRRKPMIVGLLVFIFGTILSWLADSFELFIAGRILQGIGSSAPRVITTAIVRDIYSGREMAKILSFILSIFIITPMLAPSIGQVILNLGDWRMIMIFILIMALVAIIWFGLLQEETLKKADRRFLNWKILKDGAGIVLKDRQAMVFTFASGVIFGGFLGYLNSAQHIFQTIFQVGDLFGIYFAILTISFGTAFVINAKLVEKYGMMKISLIAVFGHFIMATFLFIVLALNDFMIPLFGLMALLMPMFFFIALTFSNMQALAMVKMGKVAGMASSLVGSISNFIAAPIGALIGANLSENFSGLAWGFLICSLISFLLIYHAKTFSIEEVLDHGYKA